MNKRSLCLLLTASLLGCSSKDVATDKTQGGAGVAGSGSSVASSGASGNVSANGSGSDMKSDSKGNTDSGASPIQQNSGAQSSGNPGAVNANAGNWERWGGANTYLVSNETFLDSVEAPKFTEVWSANVGTGFSSMAVSGDSLFTMGYDAEKSEDVVYALSKATGEVKWTYRYPCKIFDNLHEGGPGATPTIADGKVYTFSREGLAHCLDAATGAKIWSTQIAEKTGIKPPEWGYTSSALVDGNKVVFEAGATVALNLADGEMIWATESETPGYGSVAVMESGSDRYYVSLSNQNLKVVTVDGQLVAKGAWTTQYATSAWTPIIANNMVFVSTGYGQGCSLWEFTAEKTLVQKYQNKSLASHMNNASYVNGILYGVHGNSHQPSNCYVVCMDMLTGERKWAERNYGCGSSLVVGNKLVVLSDEGTLVVAKATPERYEEVANQQVIDGKCWTVPVVSEGAIFCRNAAGKIVCVKPS